MQEQLTLLEGLQRLDLQLQETEQAISAVPEKLKSMKKDVDAVEALLEKEQRQLSDVQAYRADLDQAVKNDQAQLSKTKAKLAQIKTSKEYMAVQREFETNRRLVAEREEESKKLAGAIEETHQSIAKHEEELNELRQHVKDEEEESERRLVELKKSAEQQRASRQQTAEKVGKSLLRKYDQIRRLRGGLAVVKATDGVCSGCRMQLPPQLYNTLQRLNSIEQCPTCYRIVVFIPPGTSDSADTASSSQNSAT